MENNDQKRKEQSNKRKLIAILNQRQSHRMTFDVRVTDMDQFRYLQEASAAHKFKITRINPKPSIKRSFAKKMPDSGHDTSFMARVEFY